MLKSKNYIKRLPVFIGILIAAIFLFFNVVILHDYGQNWDESAHFFRGQAFLNFFLTGNKKYENLPPFKLYQQNNYTVLFDPLDKKDIPRVSMYQHKKFNFIYWSNAFPGGHPPLSDIFAAVFNVVLFQNLGFINDVDSYHVYSVFLAAVLIGVIFVWVHKNYGIFTAVIASLSLTLYPIFFAESHFNIKDVPEAVFYSLSIIAFYEGIVRRKNLWILASAIFFSFAFATKFNILFMPFTLLPWIILYLLKLKDKRRYINLIPSFIVYPIIVITVFFASWPFLWPDPIGRFSEVMNYYREIGNNSVFDPRYITFFGLNTYAAQWILFVTPLVTLFFSLFGIIYALRNGFREKTKITLLILIWFLIPILRVTRPSAGIYGGIRHIMEYMPAMAILSGIGANWLREQIIGFPVIRNKNIFSNKKKTGFLISFLLILAFVPITIKLISLHPNEGIYYNPLIGGLKGAKERELLDAGSDLGNVNKQATKWINSNAEPNAKVALFAGLGSDFPDTQLRRDLSFYNGFRSGLERKGEYVIGLVENFGIYPDSFMMDYYNNFLIPVHEIKVDNTPLIKIWKNDIAHTKKKYLNEKLINDYKKTITSNSLELNFGKLVFLTRVNITFSNKNCKKSEEGSIEVMEEINNWIIWDNDLQASGFSPNFYFFKPSGEYVYPFAATALRSLKLNFTAPDSCFNYTDKIEVHGIEKL